MGPKVKSVKREEDDEEAGGGNRYKLKVKQVAKTQGGRNCKHHRTRKTWLISTASKEEREMLKALMATHEYNMSVAQTYTIRSKQVLQQLA